ncbi:zinc-dependent alcohol dehydrogenase family protein [Variovorax sp. NFACC27]|uniref:zinc-dependent alcohol dehydrogenase family protein n=1 Tax=unclassified Variovorax TaxID=663243 RepID=UPI0008986D73|nr:NADPH2:quinone reductase [Variovorax sp. NFACC28]SEG11691.1 NADPH2:quinone reductase [Variovorax sp. NFACC29]SFC05713.1 NADPH2:quinone reductase [Variovorax sp. NFACC26]SFH07676.1 NADPH2:quinone reductase [Variovorax sp. NFACC27]
MSRVIHFNRVGGAEVLEFVDVEVAAPLADEVQISVKALGINRAEIMYRNGQYVIDPVFPAKMGYEAAGDVTAVGSNVTDFKVGDRVSVIPAFSFANYGMYGELVNAPVHAVVKIPDGISYEESAATWMKFVTVFGALVLMGGMKAGGTVVLGASSSSLGLAAIQMANMVGATPVALTRSLDIEKQLKAAGAAHVFTGDDPELTDKIRALTGGKGARLVFDPVGGPGARALFRAMAYEGIYYQYGALSPGDLPVPVMDVLSQHLTLRGYELFEITEVPERLAAAKKFITEGLSSGALKPVIDKVFDFADIADAHRYMEAGSQIGKIVVKV